MSPDLGDLITPAGVIHDAHAGNKRQLIALMATRAARLTGFDEALIQDVILEREALGSTGFGAGTAIPHGRLDRLGRITAVVAKLATPIDFVALDGQPVDLVVMMLAPGGAGADHLKALARVSRALRDVDLCAKLRGSASADALFALLAGTSRSEAA